MKYFIEMWERAFDFKGRTNQKEFWAAYRLSLLIYIVFIGIALVVMESDNEVAGGVMALIAMPFVLTLVVPMLSMQLRRFHDVGRSLAPLIFCIIFTPLAIGFIIKLLILKKDSAGDNQWGIQNQNSSFANQQTNNAYMAQQRYFVDRQITADQLPQKKKWAKNMLILFLASFVLVFITMAILIALF